MDPVLLVSALGSCQGTRKISAENIPYEGNLGFCTRIVLRSQQDLCTGKTASGGISRIGNLQEKLVVVKRIH